MPDPILPAAPIPVVPPAEPLPLSPYLPPLERVPVAVEDDVEAPGIDEYSPWTIVRVRRLSPRAKMSG